MPDPTGLWELAPSLLRALFPLSLEVSHGKPGEKKKIAEFTVAIRLDYRLSKSDWSEEDVPHYVGISGFLHAWPYFRAEIQSLSTKLGLPPLVLPPAVSGYAAKHVSVVRAAKHGQAAHTTPRKKLRKPPSRARSPRRA
jgi:hypothetical protein